MDKIHDLSFGGERPLFGAHDVCLENITITDGESGIKCCHDIECHDSKFFGKYPWWHVDRSLITSCYFAPASRSAIWYSNDMVMKDCVIDGPKFFREMKNLELEDVKINDADETFWRIDGLKLKNVELHGGTNMSSSTARMSRFIMPKLRPRTLSGSATMSLSTIPSSTVSTWLGILRTSLSCAAISAESSRCAIWIM